MAIQNEAMPATARPVSLREVLLQQAASLTSGDRDREYGDPMVNLTCATDLKRVFRTYQKRSGRVMSNAEVEAIDMVLTKLSRLACGPRAKEDTYIDGACYFAIAGEAFVLHQNGEIDSSGFTRTGALGKRGDELTRLDGATQGITASDLKNSQFR